jgi:hypothetical protein
VALERPSQEDEEAADRNKMIMMGRLKGWSLKASNNFVIKFPPFLIIKTVYEQQPKSSVSLGQDETQIETS